MALLFRQARCHTLLTTSTQICQQNPPAILYKSKHLCTIPYHKHHHFNTAFANYHLDHSSHAITFFGTFSFDLEN